MYSNLALVILVTAVVVSAVFIIHIRKIHNNNLELQESFKFDQLTGLPNRNQLIAQLDYLISVNNKIAILWINLDGFKDVNDALGWQVGDQLLKKIADRLLSLLRPQDILCRPSGDDFVMILPGSGEDYAAIQAEKTIQNMQTPLILVEQQFVLSASIGISFFPIDSIKPEILLQQSETAMHGVKQNQRGRFYFYRTEMFDATVRKLAISASLKQAIYKNELYIEYQPQILLDKKNKVIGAEALLRWNSKEHGFIPPLEFIPIAEDSGIIIDIGRWVLETVIKQISDWSNKGLQLDTIAINISSLQLNHAGFVEYIEEVLANYNVSPQCLELEITESAAMKYPEQAALTLKRLSDAKINISIDDFGTGYSSLSYLKRFNINTIKIDKTFINEIIDNVDDQAITNAIIDMAHNLGMKVIAEGVETKEQLDYLRSRGCDAAQGYYYSPSLSAEKFEIWKGKFKSC